MIACQVHGDAECTARALFLHAVSSVLPSSRELSQHGMGKGSGSCLYGIVSQGYRFSGKDSNVQIDDECSGKGLKGGDGE